MFASARMDRRPVCAPRARSGFHPTGSRPGAVCGRCVFIPTRPAPPRREDLVNVRVGEGGPSARLYPLEARSGFHPTGVSPQCTVGLGCVGTGAVDLTIQSDRTSAAVKSGRMV